MFSSQKLKANPEIKQGRDIDVQKMSKGDGAAETERVNAEEAKSIKTEALQDSVSNL